MKKAVLLPAAEWEQIVSELEELDDIRAYDAAQAYATDRLPFEQAVREIQKNSRARVTRSTLEHTERVKT